MNKLLATLVFALFTVLAWGQTVHEYASVEFSPGLRKLGVFSTAAPAKVIDLKPVHMDRADLDIITFFNEVQDME